MNIFNACKVLLLAILFVCFAFNFPIPSALAQDSENSERQISDDMTLRKQDNGWVVNEATTIEDVHANDYLKANYQNLSKLYWKKGMFDINNNEHIDQYMMINECEITSENIRDEFEWLEVRKAARELLKNEKDNFSDHFQIILPIDLGTYDMEKKGFPLINDTAYENLRRIQVGGNYIDRVCGFKGVKYNYPPNMILILKRPFTYNFVALDEHIAQAFILRRKYQKPKVPEDLIGEYFNRLAFIRIRFEIESSQGFTRIDNETLAVMVGKIHGVDIFEDASETRVLTSVSYIKEDEK